MPFYPTSRISRKNFTVETVLETLQVESQDDPVRKQQLAAILFYLQLLITTFEQRWQDVHQGITNYVTLMDQLRRAQGKEELSIVTFNYDCMIEKALSSIGVVINDVTDYVQHPTFKLFKLHGSVNWVKHLSAPFTRVNIHRDNADVIRELIESAEKIETSDEFYTCNSCPTGKIDDIALWPALAIPFTTKLVFQCPASHIELLKKSLPETKKIVTLGWRGAEHHFLKILSEALNQRQVSILPIAGSEEGAQEVIDNLRSADIFLAPIPSQPGFSNAIVTRAMETFCK